MIIFIIYYQAYKIGNNFYAVGHSGCMEKCFPRYLCGRLNTDPGCRTLFTGSLSSLWFHKTGVCGCLDDSNTGNIILMAITHSD